uniref:Uncharacterized protein n=1 Tax=Avena sativa TaxID=4498 RepID=A0ACD5VLL0_AVESA
MLRLQSCILTRLLSSPATTPVSPLHRLLSAAAAAPAASPSPAFAVEQYLVDTCGLTRAQALKVSTKLSHLKAPSKPDGVLAFLAGLGLSSAAVAAAVAKDPKLLCTSVTRTLAPTVAGLTDLGLSRSDIGRLASLAPASFRGRSVVSNLPYYLLLYGSYDNILRVIKKNSTLLVSNLEKVVKPNVACLLECELDACDIAKLCISRPWLLTTNLERVQEMVACVESLGVPRGSGMFRLALQAVSSLGEDKIAGKLEYLKNMFRWSDAEVGIAVCRAPVILTRSKGILQSRSEFLISEVALEPAYIAQL